MEPRLGWEYLSTNLRLVCIIILVATPYWHYSAKWCLDVVVGAEYQQSDQNASVKHNPLPGQT